MDCIFCQIAAGKIPADILYKDDKVIAFRDVSPQAPVHLLIIPREHIPSLAHVTEAEAYIVARMISVANEMARQEDIAESGYRLVINCGEQGGQLVPHLHMHLLGGRQMSGKLG